MESQKFSLFYIRYDNSLIINYITGRGDVMGSLLANSLKYIVHKDTQMHFLLN